MKKNLISNRDVLIESLKNSINDHGKCGMFMMNIFLLLFSTIDHHVSFGTRHFTHSSTTKIIEYIVLIFFSKVFSYLHDEFGYVGRIRRNFTRDNRSNGEKKPWEIPFWMCIAGLDH